MKLKAATIFMIFTFHLISCGGGNGLQGGTETGTTVDNLQAVASTLAPQMSSSESSSLSLAISFGSEDDFSTFLDSSNVYLLTDIFGSPDDDPAPVTRIRVLLNELENTLGNVFTSEDVYSCSGQSGLLVLNEGDSFEIPFYGEISNGTSADRPYDCIMEVEEENALTLIFGQDEEGVLRLITMSDNTSTNTESTDERGSSVRLMQVVHTTYQETTESEETMAYLDMHYAQATVYPGPDETFDSNDDVVFKSRTRITGRATLAGSGAVSAGTGDFTVTKYDQGLNDGESTPWTIVTQTLGRGSYGEDEYSLFQIQSDHSSVADSSGTFCIQNSTDALPSHAEEENCSELETSFAWGEASFPFSLSPSLEENFEDNTLFSSDDLIENSGSNFTIPTYETTSSGDE